ncbi:hypothetical protein KKA33_01350 [Patescibacteria group bacterium]|nr:hypothetical protein [Patescibacteria group bacterium]
MSNTDKPGNEDDKIIHLPDRQPSVSRKISDRHIEIIEEESVIPVDSVDYLVLADAKLQAHQGEILIVDTRDVVLQTLREAGHLRDEQIEIDPETGDYFIRADDGQLMEWKEYASYVVRKRLQEEADKRRKGSSQEAD